MKSEFFLGNEWKTRFENQEEINRHLARQILLLEKNIEQAKEEQKTGLLIERSISSKYNRSYF